MEKNDSMQDQVLHLQIQEEDRFVSLTHRSLNVQEVMDKVRSDQAGAILIFAGTVRSNSDCHPSCPPVESITYTSYVQRAILSLMDLARKVQVIYDLKKIAIVHRLGCVPVGEEGVVIAVSSKHSSPAFQAGEMALTHCKLGLEVWKKENLEKGQPQAI